MQQLELNGVRRPADTPAGDTLIEMEEDVVEVAVVLMTQAMVMIVRPAIEKEDGDER